MAKRRKASPAPHDSKPFPCPSGCGGTLAAANEHGELVDTDKEGASRWICVTAAGHCSGGCRLCAGCGFSIDAGEGATGDERCPADGAPLTFMPDLVGDTCGGLTLRGWNKCEHCGGIWLTRRGIPHAGGRSDGRWRLASGGRSLDVGGMRLRVDGRGTGATKSGSETISLMARISRMPVFEAALERIANGELDADAMRALAADALSIGDGAEEIES